MKKILIGIGIASVILITSIVLFVNHAAEIKKQEETERMTMHVNAMRMFFNSLPSWYGRKIYPDNYGGDYTEGETWFFLVTDINETSEYQYLKDVYPYTEFKEVEYSYNYLRSLIDEYEKSAEFEKPEYGEVDDRQNRAVIYIYDEEKLAKMQSGSDGDLPLIFKEPTIFDVL